MVIDADSLVEDNKKTELTAPASVPLTVPFSENETMEQFRDRWKKVDALPAEKKEILSSEFTIEKIEDVAKRFRLTYEETCDISRLFRSIVFGELNDSQIDSYLKQKVQHLEQPDRDNVKNVIDEILLQKVIIEKGSEIEKKEVTKLAVSEALLQYPKLGEQNVSSEQIKLRYLPTPVRPSIKNWITDFHDAMGAGKHSPIDRGNFLFHSENGKKLSAVDRQKLGTILKSLDEQTLLNINPETQAVVFDEIESQFPVSMRQPVTPVQTTRPNTVTTMSAGRNSHDVFGDLSPAPKNEAIQNKQLDDKVQGFFARTQNDNIPRTTPVNSAPRPVKVPNRPTVQENLAKEDFFSIPQSKPPIGSEHFNAEIPAVKEAPIFVEKPAEVKVQPVHETVAKPVNDQDRDSMSDEMLYKMLQEKKIKRPEKKQDSFSGVISFSSPQKLPAEQISEPPKPQIKPVAQQPIQKPVVPVSAPVKPHPKSPYHITPSDYSYEKTEDAPKISKNIVDLR